MRTSFTLLIFILFIGCKNTNTKKNVDFNEYIEQSEEYDHIIGTLKRQDIEEFPYSMWFEKGYQNYLIDNEICKQRLIDHDYYYTVSGDSFKDVCRATNLNKAQWPMYYAYVHSP